MMRLRVLLASAFAVSLTANTLIAQQPRAIANDPGPGAKSPTFNQELVLESRGSKIMGVFLAAEGRSPHGTVILLHGFPGYEQNMDLAQSLRRDGWNVVAMHYRGAWGSQGDFSFTHCMEDVSTILAFLQSPASVAKFHINSHRIVVVGHSMGGFMTVAALAQHPELAGGVVITEGNPARETEDFAHAEPADLAPLAGTSAKALEQEGKAHVRDWSFEAFAARITPRPVLDFSANDGLKASNDALVATLKKAGDPVTQIQMDTDHSFSNHRIALQIAVLRWLHQQFP